jgi:RNA polymerase sigma factor (sigma-70 family)
MKTSSTAELTMAKGEGGFIHKLEGLRTQIFSFIRSRIKTVEEAEDILQDVFYQLSASSQPIEEVSAWLYKVARNRITDSYRKKKLPLADDIFSTEDEGSDLADWREFILYDTQTPETEYLRNLFWEALESALNELPGEQKQAFILHEMESIPFQEMEKILGVPAATLVSRKRYAVLHLRNRLEGLKNEILNH